MERLIARGLFGFASNEAVGFFGRVFCKSLKTLGF
jgi:hypothetical protein